MFGGLISCRDIDLTGRKRRKKYCAIWWRVWLSNASQERAGPSQGAMIAAKLSCFFNTRRPFNKIKGLLLNGLFLYHGHAWLSAGQPFLFSEQEFQQRFPDF
jgi:hypothetical protein